MSMTKEMVREKMKDKNVVVLNVLPQDAFRKVHIKGSENLPLANNPDAFVRMVGRLYDMESFFITHCSNVNCDAGPTAAKVLRENGFEAEDYPGGMEDWIAAGFPVQGTEAAQFALR
jgi:rhodanese-related sulfurtransferase